MEKAEIIEIRLIDNGFNSQNSLFFFLIFLEYERSLKESEKTTTHFSFK